ncbi:Origin recognition complex subunit 5 [Basidiobolus ranarum]|uniref:Origin recognition complex subunit 5 n=1 Tax=Basidiobolus ranarum TaxID=34480 RepID=A0ABR2W3A9_9FUNG
MLEQEDKVTELCKAFPGRSKQIRQLLVLLGKPTDVTVPSIFVYGHQASGKTSILKTLFHEMLPKTNYAFLNCVECYTPRLLFEHALNQLSGTIPSFENKFKGHARCDSINEFLIQLGQVCQYNNPLETRYLILDKAERLRDMSGTVLPALLRLSELTKQNICVIMVSSVVWEKFRSKSGCFEPLVIRFPEYTKDILFYLFKLMLEC